MKSFKCIKFLCKKYILCKKLIQNSLRYLFLGYNKYLQKRLI